MFLCQIVENYLVSLLFFLLGKMEASLKSRQVRKAFVWVWIPKPPFIQSTVLGRTLGVYNSASPSVHVDKSLLQIFNGSNR